MEINNSRQVRSLAFQGYQHKKTETGAQAYHFNATFDARKYNCEVQFFNVGMDKKGNLFVSEGPDGAIDPFFTKEVPPEGAIVEPSYDLDLEDKQPFAYRMVLTEKNNPNNKVYLREDSANGDGFTIVTRTGSTVIQQGPMYLAMPDTFATGYVYAGFKDNNTGDVIEPNNKQKYEISEKIRKTNRGFATIAGGTMAGLEAKIPEIAQAGNKRLITTPLQGGANVAADKYWAENNMLPAGGIGNRNNLNSLQRKAYQYGMNTVDDGTFTSEGLQGIHFQRAIKWMDNDNKPDEFYYFRMAGLKDTALGLGVVPKNFENMSCKLVNCEYDFKLKSDGMYDIKENKDYDPDKPTYIQIFDNTLVSDEQRNDKKNVITAYDKTTPDGNKNAINTHDDTVQPYYFKADSNELKQNILNLNEVNFARQPKDRLKYDSPRGTMFVGTLSGIEISPKVEGGFVCWNANTDIEKYNYFASNYDTELLSDIKDPAERAIEYDNIRRANCQLRDMACNVARYRTSNVRKNITEYTAKTIGEIPSDTKEAYEKIANVINSQDPKKPVLPNDVALDKNVVENVLEDNYEMRPKYENYDDALISSLMELPLDSLEFSPEVQGALSSPYLSKLSPDNDHIGETRFEAMNDSSYKIPQKYSKTYNKMNEVFTKDIKSFADKVLLEVNKNSKEKLFDENGEMTEYGQYLIPLVGQDIARYAVTKALMPTAKAKPMKNGEITYDYEDMTNRGTLAHMNINGDSQKDEANQIVNRIQKGVNRLMNDNVKFVADSINKRFENTNANSLKLAEVMVDRGGYGLDWRFDAAKDVADMDSVYNGDQSLETAKRNNVRFWGDMCRTIYSENPNSYTVAEVTDVGDDFTDALINLAGITSEANYSYFFSGITSMFSYDNETGDDTIGGDDRDSDGNITKSREQKIADKLEESIGRFAQRNLDYKRNSYTFATNHDKPRMIHCMSMDMGLFHSNLNDKANKDYRKTAYMIMNDKISDSLNQHDYDIIDGKTEEDYFKNVSSKAIANGELLRNSIGYANNELHFQACENIRNNVSHDKQQAEFDKADRRYKKLYELMSKATADVVNGDYYKNNSEKASNKNVADSYKKVLEKDGFGTKPVSDAFDIIYDQAVYLNSKADSKDKIEMLNDKELLEYRNMVDSKATEVGRVKTRIAMRYLGALAGNPTLYAGDEYGMTGYEDPVGNTYLQNRNPLDHLQTEVIKDKDGKNTNKYYRQDVADYKESIYDIFRARKSDDMNLAEAINNGTMYKLNQLTGTNGKHCSAVLYQASNGAMNLSVMNPNGISMSPKAKLDELRPIPMDLERIRLDGIKGQVTITPGTEFRNINPNDQSVYKVHEFNGEYYIKRENGSKNGANIEMNETNAPDGVMMLYHIPKDIEAKRTELVKKKAESRQYYNPVHNIPQSDAYSEVKKPEVKKGENIDLTSKEG